MTNRKGEMIMDVTTAKAEVENAINDLLRATYNGPARSKRSQLRRRDWCIRVLHTALAKLIAEDVAIGNTPWPATVMKFRILSEMVTNDIIG